MEDKNFGPVLDQREKDTRYIGSRQKEEHILNAMEEWWEEIIQIPQGGKGESDSYKDLGRELGRHFAEWQFGGTPNAGLRSGGAGEAFVRLLGLGILKEFPTPIRIKRSEYKILQSPTTPDDVGEVLIRTFSGPDRGIGYQFELAASLNTIRDRITVLNQEIQTLQEEILHSPNRYRKTT